jgi:chromosome segregation ATPase
MTMFNAVIMPEVSINEMRGVLSLLDLIGNPKSKAAAEFLQKLSAEKDAAVEAAAKASTDSAAAAASLEEAKKLHADMEERLATKIREHELKAAMLDSRHQNLKDDEQNLANTRAVHDAEVQKHYHEHNTRAADLLQRENAISAREKKIERDDADLMRRQAEFDKLVAPLQAAAKLGSGG